MKNVEIFGTIYLKKKLLCAGKMDPISFQRTLYLSSLIFEFTSVDDDGLAKRARIVHLEYFKAPRCIEREKKNMDVAKSSAPRALFTHPESLLLIFG